MSGMNQHISLKQKQELALKPKMLQSLKMLALPILELESYIRQELQSNPLLELREEKEDDDLQETSSDQNAPESNTELEDVDTQEEISEALNEARQLTDILDQWNEYHSNGGYQRSESSERDQGESLIRYEENNKELFLEQLYPLNLPEHEIDFITEIVDSCDVYGFLTDDYDIYAVARRFKISKRRADELHELVLQISPKGITSRDISECLSAQLTEEQRENPIIRGMVTEQFDNLIHRRYQKIASHYNVSEDTIMAYREQISKLDPKPGLRILSSNAAYVYPDVTLKFVDGEYVVIINDHITPNIIISPRYRKMINRGYFDRQTVSYVRERINSAKFLIKSIYMRMRTLEQVSLSIVKYQHDFFYNGSGIMQPLTYSVIAQDIGKSESTISRVVKHKYAETPYGIFAFKDFFTSTAGRDDNFEEISRQKAKGCIIRLIEAENKNKPLSDQKLVEILKSEGLNISRRIIAKYRDEMGILNSRLRKQ
ncbi:MAG: RNA polymerase factor sigma-54 [Candidatus Cloacimonetes bacterium]|jgi:RNA polymerase sigma-54 factor|nr:RNA polymerase factor sigma-54 [Candidatus Cloacimonadota bacterium]MDD2423389.1 RNA polymerase factor sigma-54 [Candidatus Cloacimonadota bacterium]MDD3563775.1 RNA polymerase factor sigma-54 [Candidatus Cloacimonadota bacterium]MDD4276555.1 RNA polymerase factor sigma-54 [Candidatus Cloacimonadota bacterium]MDY0325709.1 RNA polymerase factor sigma-54 [Candidatus Cloacimonadaceae bacterium]